MKKYNRVLTIAGSDSGGGAGIQADIKTISAMGCYAASAITAITVQNTRGVEAVHAVPLDILAGQIDAVLSDIGADAVKIGMLHSAEVVNLVADKIEQYGIRNVVLDPVMVSTSGHRLIEESAVEHIVRRLLPLARVITPNIPEAEILYAKLASLHESAPESAQIRPELKITSEADFPEVAKVLSHNNKVSVLLKAGHLSGDDLVDYFYNAEDGAITQLPSKRIYTRNTHGTGCTLSSAFASALARGEGLTQAAVSAKKYIAGAIISGADYEIGHGHGPVNHLFFSFYCQSAKHNAECGSDDHRQVCKSPAVVCNAADNDLRQQ